LIFYLLERKRKKKRGKGGGGGGPKKGGGEGENAWCPSLGKRGGGGGGGGLRGTKRRNCWPLCDVREGKKKGKGGD